MSSSVDIKSSYKNKIDIKSKKLTKQRRYNWFSIKMICVKGHSYF